MVAGHLREKSGYYYAVLNYTDSLGKRKTKWISTGLTVKGNKKRAEAILMDARRNFNPEEPKVILWSSCQRSHRYEFWKIGILRGTWLFHSDYCSGSLSYIPERSERRM